MGTAANNRKFKDANRAATMKRLGIVRETQRCPNCYKLVARDCPKSSYKHICK
jgi:hypothetical protein